MVNREKRVWMGASAKESMRQYALADISLATGLL